MDVKFLFLMAILPSAAPLSFNFTGFNSSNVDITYKGDAAPMESVIQLTKLDTWRSGRAIYTRPVHLWDKSLGTLADFTTHFSFSIKKQSNVTPAEGFAFFIASLQYHVGIDVNSLVSRFWFNTTIRQSLQYEVDLKDYLSEWTTFGFASATGMYH
ncbi:seed lectin-like [Hibiscus syriacus]|uniref:seed lectin-like n=1 Tax=Hibiscus syriacus TaxID=106335 RepID=UPI00192494BC|nr:seed lectin-like [Hibiscus syriacus]